MRLLLPPPPPIYCPLQLAKRHGLEDSFQRFIRVSRPPENLQCLLLVCRNLLDVFRALPPFWQNVDPFQEWTLLFDVLLANHYEIFRLNEQAGVEFVTPARRKRKKQPLRGKMEDYPLFAMLCTTHESESLRATKYGALQLHLLHAHWRKQEDFLEEHPDHPGEIREKRRSKENDIKLANDAARAVRYFQVEALGEWLDLWDTSWNPNSIVDQLPQARPSRFCRADVP